MNLSRSSFKSSARAVACVAKALQGGQFQMTQLLRPVMSQADFARFVRHDIEESMRVARALNMRP